MALRAAREWRMTRAMSVKLRDGVYYLRKRVPARYARVEPRAEVWISLATDSEAVAQTKAPKVWAAIEASWEARLAGADADAERKYETARNLAATRGFAFLTASDVAALPLDALLKRVEAVPPAGNAPADETEATAILGGVKAPDITVRRALEIYWGLAKDRLVGKSKDQIRRWKNPRKKAVENFVAEIGNKPLSAITGDDMLAFRDWWITRITEEGLTAGSGNKDLIHLGDIWKTVNRMKRLGLVLPLSDLSIKAGETNSWPPFSTEWIKTKILAPGALDGLNPQARAIVLGMVNTGYRPSEGQNLLPHHIRLDAKIPHLSIEPEGRQLKNRPSRRLIPLVGVSLEAFKAFPEGFPRYRDAADLSATANAFLRENGLMETDRHVLYSLRHSFEDRMIAAGVDERIRRDLFGHSLKSPRYGKGASLEQLQSVVQSIAL